jgi:hypothetical protein
MSGSMLGAAEAATVGAGETSDRAQFAAFAATIFAGAFLLFQVQPLIVHYILPWFGGGSAVWTTALVFFQVMLVGGYAYAHASVRWLPTRGQALLHAGLLVVAVALLPITPSPAWRPESVDAPTLRILLLLGASVGIPYLLLASTSPLLQAWLAGMRPGPPPYRLYALSNAGSLLALVSYPFAVEPLLGRATQAWAWSWCFGLFALASIVCAAAVGRRGGSPARATNATQDGAPRPARLTRALWLALPATASLLLLAITNQISHDVAAVPFLWVLPLALYLLSYVIVFERESWYSRPVWLGALALAMGGAVWLLHLDGYAPIVAQIAGFSGILFVCCMICHGELVRLKPPADHLTSYYLHMAAGGALGGAFVALVAPQLFDLLLELHLGLAACCSLVLVLLATDPHSRLRGGRPRLAWAALGMAWLCVGAGLTLHLHNTQQGVVERSRSFYGALRVFRFAEGTPNAVAALTHGRTTHGLQYLAGEQRRRPMLYYSEGSGIGLVFRHLRWHSEMKVGAVGLGIGAIGAYARPGDRFRFYEIDPEVHRMATTYFRHLEDARGEVEVVLADGRLALEREAPNAFDVLVLDAFSSDAIPVHLLTREAFALYDRHLAPDGVLAVHISSAHFDLEPVVRRLAGELGLDAIHVSSPEHPRGYARADWMLLSRDRRFLSASFIRNAEGNGSRGGDRRAPLWTDDHATVLAALRLWGD